MTRAGRSRSSPGLHALPLSLPPPFWSDVDRIALCVHRPSAASPEFRRIVERLQIPAGSFVVSAARHIAAGVVTLEELQLLGRYESRSIIAANARRHVELGFFNELDRERYMPTDDFRAASLLVLDVQAHAAENLWSGAAADLAELAASAGTVVARVTPSIPTPAFSAQRAAHDVTPASPAGQLLAFVTELRYLRSDLHALALAGHGFYGPLARAVDRAWKRHDVTPDDLQRLKDRGLAVQGASGWELAEMARLARAEAEVETEALTALALEATPEEAFTMLSKALVHLPGDDPRPVTDR